MGRIAAIVCALFLAACAGRTPSGPPPVMQAGDETLSCEQLANEMTRNERRIERINAALIDMDRRRLAPGPVIGGFGEPSSADDSRAARMEIDAYRLRNDRLRGLQAARRCGRASGGSGTGLPRV